MDGGAFRELLEKYTLLVEENVRLKIKVQALEEKNVNEVHTVSKENSPPVDHEHDKAVRLEHINRVASMSVAQVIDEVKAEIPNVNTDATNINKVVIVEPPAKSRKEYMKEYMRNKRAQAKQTNQK